MPLSADELNEFRNTMAWAKVEAELKRLVQSHSDALVTKTFDSVNDVMYHQSYIRGLNHAISLINGK